MLLDFHQVDAFTDRPFAGNPAMVYRLDAWLSDELMQQIAAEHNLSETAFLVKEPAGWRIRWFTPTAEVPLCGHATLASAHVLFEVFDEPGEVLELNSLSGPLRVTREEGRLALNFPAQPPSESGSTVELQNALGVDVVDALNTANHLLVLLESEQAVRDCQPDFAALARLPSIRDFALQHGIRPPPAAPSICVTPPVASSRSPAWAGSTVAKISATACMSLVKSE